MKIYWTFSTAAPSWGTGGGGSLDEGIEMIDEALAARKEFKLTTFEEMSPEDVIGTPYACGAISPLTEEEIKKYARLKETDESFYILCMKQLERFLGREVSAVISTELGGGNTATAFYVGAMTGRPIVDGDPGGPERTCPPALHLLPPGRSHVPHERDEQVRRGCRVHQRL